MLLDLHLQATIGLTQFLGAHFHCLFQFTLIALDRCGRLAMLAHIPGDAGRTQNLALFIAQGDGIEVQIDRAAVSSEMDGFIIEQVLSLRE